MGEWVPMVCAFSRYILCLPKVRLLYFIRQLAAVPNRLQKVFFVLKKAFWTVCAGIFFLGCGAPGVNLSVPTIEDRKIFDAMPSSYMIGPGDRIEVIFRIGFGAEDAQYKIGVGDRLTIEFYSNDKLSRSVTVLPDGTISMPPQGMIHVAGKSPRELADELVQQFKEVVRDPLITVTVNEYNKNAQEFIRAVTNQQQGQAKTIQIGSDGLIAFPFLEEIDARGLTLAQLKAVVAAKYAQVVPNLSISLSLVETVNNVAYVLGEVRKPGLVEISRPTSVIHLLSQAQVDMNTGNLKTVAIISHDKDHKPVARLVNVHKLLKQGNMTQDIRVKQYDVVYVPKRPIASVDLFVQQYFGAVYALVPDFFKVGVNGDFIDLLNLEIQ